MRKLILTAAAALLMAVPAFAANSVAGKWTGETQGRQGPQPVVLEIKADGSGTMTTGTQPAVTLTEGKVTGTKVAFTTVREVQGNQIAIKWSGEAKGDELTLTREVPNMGAGGGGGGAAGGGGEPRPAPAPVVLKRSK